MKKFVYVLCSLVFIFSCSDEGLRGSDSTVGKAEGSFTEQEAKILFNLRNSDNRIEMDEAIKLVETAIALLDKESPSESGLSRSVNSVSALLFTDIKASILKSGEYSDMGISDTLAYVFNFKDSSGYAIISIDTRAGNPLLAFTKRGSLFGKTDNPGLAIFLERLEGYVLKSIIETEQRKPTLDDVLGKSSYESGKAGVVAPVVQANSVNIQVLKNISPLVPVQWGQGEPFNDLLNSSNPQCTKYWAGCVATATAQIMSYWQLPYSTAWPTLNQYKKAYDFEVRPTDNIYVIATKKAAKKMVAKIFQEIGTDPIVSMQYGCDISTANVGNAMAFLAVNGYMPLWNVYQGNYHVGFVNVLLDSYRSPIMAEGCGPSCHAWVMDGLLILKVTVTTGATETIYQESHIHNNWGWNGDSDGYFLSSVFNPGVHNFQNVFIHSFYR